MAIPRPDRYRVQVEQYRQYQEQGFIAVRQLVAQEEVEELKEHAMDILEGRVNSLTRVVEKYDPPVPVPADPGDVVFFHPHLLHRSHPNRSPRRWRRAFVSHYCNARSWVPWNHGAPFDGPAANYLHILARGSTHLPFARPRFNTPCAAL